MDLPHPQLRAGFPGIQEFICIPLTAEGAQLMGILAQCLSGWGRLIHLPPAQNRLHFQEHSQIYFWKAPLAASAAMGELGMVPAGSEMPEAGEEVTSPTADPKPLRGLS